MSVIKKWNKWFGCPYIFDASNPSTELFFLLLFSFLLSSSNSPEVEFWLNLLNWKGKIVIWSSFSGARRVVFQKIFLIDFFLYFDNNCQSALWQNFLTAQKEVEVSVLASGQSHAECTITVCAGNRVLHRTKTWDQRPAQTSLNPTGIAMSETQTHPAIRSYSLSLFCPLLHVSFCLPTTFYTWHAFTYIQLAKL